MSIGSNIKRLRTDAQLSQAELGKIAGVTDKAVSTWEADIKTPRMGAVEKMAAYFGVPKSAILDDVYQAPVPVPPGFEPLPEMDSVPLVGRIAGYLIQSAGGVPRDHNNVRKSFQSLMKRLGIDGVSPHTCRHTAATRMLAAGLPVEVVQQILGHADATTTLNIYTHPDVTTLVSGVRKMD